MDSLNPRNRPSASAAAVVEAPTLKEALRQVRQRYGEDARVIRSRTINRRQPGGLGQEKVVEVLVDAASRRAGSRERTIRPQQGSSTNVGVGGWRDLTGDIAAEVQRIEQLVQHITREQAARATQTQVRPSNRLAEALVEAGASVAVVNRAMERWLAETGAREDDRAGFMEYLAQSLRTNRGDWRELGGTHVFLGSAGCGRSELVLAVAARLAADQRQVLVLSLLPRHGGEVRRLQAEAAQHGYDAAVIQKPRQLAKANEHLSRYEVVLIDAPSFESPVMVREQAMCQELIANPSYHRHLVLSLDRDLRDNSLLARRARAWECDWLALTRLDQTTTLGKILDVAEDFPLPLSLLGDIDWPQGQPELASAGKLLELILGGGRRRATAQG